LHGYRVADEGRAHATRLILLHRRSQKDGPRQIFADLIG
jgi:hypothetical protein